MPGPAQLGGSFDPKGPILVNDELLLDSPSAGLGYTTGAGSSVTQATSRTTAVSINALTGSITTNTTALAAEAAAEFTVNNRHVRVGDVVVIAQRSGSDGGNTVVWVSTVATGSFKLKVANNNAAAGTDETGAIIINFAVIRGSTT